jgi:hypothetical protein
MQHAGNGGMSRDSQYYRVDDDKEGRMRASRGRGHATVTKAACVTSGLPERVTDH